jgi:hypothetical protein
LMAAAAVADDDEDYDYLAAPGFADVHQGVQTQQQLSAAEILLRSSSSRQQLSNSLVRGLRRASSEAAASASAAAVERRSSDGGSSSSGASAQDVADSRDRAGYLRGSSSATKQEQQRSRSRGRGDRSGRQQLFASWQLGSGSTHVDSSILKALQPADSQRRSRQQRQDQTAAAAAGAGSAWAMVNSPIHSVVKGGRTQGRPSRALDLLQDDGSGSDA